MAASELATIAPMAQPILITGAHRSGTTWVGKIVASAPGISYVHEPFNIGYPGNRVKPQFWFQYVTRESESPLYEHLHKLLAPAPAQLPEKKLPRWRRFFHSAPLPLRTLVKDPIAIFSAEWLAARFNMAVVVLIRHPAAFALSLRERKWNHDFNHFLRQQQLLNEHLSPFRQEIEAFSKEKREIIDQAILLWQLIYHMVGIYRQRHKDWLFLRHEDLAANPRRRFRKIFRHLHIKYSAEIKKTVDEYSNQTLPIDGDEHSVHRNSRALAGKWKSKLSADEIKHIRAGVEKVACNFYRDKDW